MTFKILHTQKFTCGSRFRKSLEAELLKITTLMASNSFTDFFLTFRFFSFIHNIFYYGIIKIFSYSAYTTCDFKHHWILWGISFALLIKFNRWEEIVIFNALFSFYFITSSSFIFPSSNVQTTAFFSSLDYWF